MAKHPPNWTEIERKYFIDVILPKSQKPIFGSDEHNPKGYTWDELAKIMQAGVDRIYVNTPPFTTPREYSSSALSQHWRKRCGKLAKDTGQLDEFGPKSPVAGSDGSNSPPPARAPKHQAAAPRSSKKRPHRAMFEDDEEYESSDEESVSYDEEYIDDGGDDDEYIPTRKEKPIHSKKAKKTTSSSTRNEGGLQRTLSSGHDEKTNAILNQFRASYPGSGRGTGVRPYGSGRVESGHGYKQFDSMNTKSISFDPLSLKHARMTGDRQYGYGREEIRRGSGQFYDTNIDPRLSNSRSSEPARTATVRSQEYVREHSSFGLRHFDSVQRNTSPPNLPYSRPASTRGSRTHGMSREETRRGHGSTYGMDDNTHSSSPSHSAWAGVMARATGGDSGGDSHFDMMDATSNVHTSQHTDAARASEVDGMSKAARTTQAIKKKLEEWQPSGFGASTSTTQPKRSYVVETHSQNTSELAYREDTESPSFEVQPASASGRIGKKPHTGFAGESVAISEEVPQSTVLSEDDYPSLDGRPTYRPARLSKQPTSTDTSALQQLGRIGKRSPPAPPASKVKFNPYKSNPFFDDED